MHEYVFCYLFLNASNSSFGNSQVVHEVLHTNEVVVPLFQFM